MMTWMLAANEGLSSSPQEQEDDGPYRLLELEAREIAALEAFIGYFAPQLGALRKRLAMLREEVEAERKALPPSAPGSNEEERQVRRELGVALVRDECLARILGAQSNLDECEELDPRVSRRLAGMWDALEDELPHLLTPHRD